MNRHAERDHALLSASSSARWLACPPSAVAAELYPAQDTDHTREGTLAHEVAEWVASGKSKTESLTKGQDDGITAEMLDHAQAYRDYIHEQVKGAGATILLEQRVDFSPWVPEGFGTCDAIILQGETMTIIDYKYGQGVPVSAVDNPQMKLYALGALNDYGIAYDVKTVEMHIFQPRLDNISTDHIEVEDLLLWAEKVVKPTAEMAIKGKGTHKPGDHCKFCPHAGKCRALTKVCTEYVETHGTRVGVESLAPFEVAKVLEMESLITLWLKRVKAQALDDMLDGINIPGYKVVAGREGNRKWDDELQVAGALSAAGYAMEDYTETKLLSPAALGKKIGNKKVFELLDGHIERAPGAPTIAPETDKRPAYDRLAEAKNDFE